MADTPLDPAFADPAFQAAMRDPEVAAYLQAMAAQQAQAGAAAAGAAAGAAVGGAAAAGSAAGAAANVAPASNSGLADPAFQEAMKNPEVAAYLSAMASQQPATSGGIDPIFANPELQRQLQDPAVQDYMRAMQQQGGPGGPSTVDTGGEHIKIPAGVVPTGETGINTSDGAHRAQAYFTGVDMDGVTHHYYADGSKVRMDVPIVAAPGSSPVSSEATIGLDDISIVGGRTHVKTPDGNTIVLPEGVSPDAQLQQNPDSGQYYVTSVDDNGLTHQYYADGHEAVTGVGAGFTGGGAAMSAAPMAANPAGDTGGAAAPAEASNPAGDTGGAAAPAGELHIGRAVSASSADKGAAQVGSATGEYIVKKGDTMWDIAQENAMTLGELVAKNPHIKNPNLIHPGDRVNLGTATAGDTGGAAFPTSSSYNVGPVTEEQQETIVSLKNKDEGWPPSNDTSTDPANTAMAAMEQPDTDPLKIDDHKNA